MTDNTKPTHIAYSVRNYERQGENDASWLKVGVAFAHKDGKGFDVKLDATPVNGQVVLRLNEPKPAKAA